VKISSQHLSNYFSFSPKSVEIGYIFTNVLDFEDNDQSMKINCENKSFCISFNSVNSELELGFIDKRLIFQLHNKDSLSLNLDTKSSELFLKQVFMFSNFNFEYGMSYTKYGNKSDLSYRTSLSFYPNYIFEKCAVSISNYPFSNKMDLNYYGAHINFDQINKLGVLKYNLLSQSFYNLSFELDHEKNVYEDNNSATEFSQSTNTGYSNIELKILHKTDYASQRFEYNRFELTSKISLENDGLSFGDISLSNVNIQSLHFYSFNQLTKNFKMNFELSHDQYDINSIGVIETWPFISLLESMIANRIYIKLKGTIGQFLTGISSDIQLGDYMISPGIKLVYLRPDLDLKNWQPEFLLFGIRNLHQNHLNIEKAYLLSLALNSEYNCKNFSLRLTFSQLIPVSIIKSQVEQNTAVEPSQPDPAVTNFIKKVDGGREIKISLIKYL